MRHAEYHRIPQEDEQLVRHLPPSMFWEDMSTILLDIGVFIPPIFIVWLVIMGLIHVETTLAHGLAHMFARPLH